ncbi:putative cytochrome B domain protein, partial [Toxoplasma gondii TgCatPRC2]
ICTDICSRRHQLHSQVLFGVHLRRVHGFLSVRAGQYSSSGKDSILVVTPLFKTLAHSLVVTRGLLCRGRNKLTVEAKCVTYLVREVAAGWEFKTLHATTASFVFVCIFVHVSRIPNTAIQRMKGSPNRTFFGSPCSCLDRKRELILCGMNARVL